MKYDPSLNVACSSAFLPSIGIAGAGANPPPCYIATEQVLKYVISKKIEHIQVHFVTVRVTAGRSFLALNRSSMACRE